MKMFPLAPNFKTFAEAHEAALSKVADGACIAAANAEDGFAVRVQRTDHNNTPRSRVVIHVWRDAKLVRKIEWQRLLDAPAHAQAQVDVARSVVRGVLAATA